MFTNPQKSSFHLSFPGPVCDVMYGMFMAAVRTTARSSRIVIPGLFMAAAFLVFPPFLALSRNAVDYICDNAVTDDPRAPLLSEMGQPRLLDSACPVVQHYQQKIRQYFFERVVVGTHVDGPPITAQKVVGPELVERVGSLEIALYGNETGAHAEWLRGSSNSTGGGLLSRIQRLESLLVPDGWSSASTSSSASGEELEHGRAFCGTTGRSSWPCGQEAKTSPRETVQEGDQTVVGLRELERLIIGDAISSGNTVQNVSSFFGNLAQRLAVLETKQARERARADSGEALYCSSERPDRFGSLAIGGCKWVREEEKMMLETRLPTGPGVKAIDNEAATFFEEYEFLLFFP